jgi:hypothetical protein
MTVRCVAVVGFLCVVPLIAVADDEQAKAPTLADAAWLAGSWKSAPGERTSFEEHWTAPAAGGMVGMFRMYSGERPIIFEFLMLEQESEGAILRLQHYRPGMVHADPVPIRMRMITAEPKKVVFENSEHDRPKRISYVLNDDGELSAIVETARENQPVTFSLKFRRDGK